MGHDQDLLGLLRRLEGFWAEQDAPILERLRPGLSPDQIAGLVAPLELALPEEAVIWFQWHDWADLITDVRPGTHFGNAFRPMSLARAIEECETYGELAEDSARYASSVAEHFWWPTWFPLGRKGNAPLVVDCAGQRATPIWIVDWEDEEFYLSRARSLTEVVRRWVELYEMGAYKYDAREGRWLDRWELFPLDMRRTGLV